MSTHPLRASLRQHAALQLLKLSVLFAVLAWWFCGCGPQPGDVACSGPLPVTCNCAESCSLEADGGITIVDLQLPPGEICAPRTPRCWRRDR